MELKFLVLVILELEWNGMVTKWMFGIIIEFEGSQAAQGSCVFLYSRESKMVRLLGNLSGGTHFLKLLLVLNMTTVS